LDEITRLENLEGSAINEAKIALANAATEMCRGPEAAKAAEATAQNVFTQGIGGDELPSLESQGEDILLIDALIGLDMATSKKEARRLISGGGARIEGEPIADENYNIIRQVAPIRVSAGKKKHGILTFI
jgi:tyrosyl-tRNA synthetase